MKKLNENLKCVYFAWIILFVVQVIFSICFIFKSIVGLEWLGLVSLNFSLVIFTIVLLIAQVSIKDAAVKHEKCRIESFKLAMSIVISHPDSDLSKKIVKSLNELLNDAIDK